MNEHLRNIKRTAKSGLVDALRDGNSSYVDTFQHILDQLTYLDADATIVNNDIERTTDIRRWENLKQFHSSWDERTGLLASYIPEEANSILEFGAGTRFLETQLLPHQTYTPSDVCSRGQDTIVKDLNELPYDFLHSVYDVVVFSGVLEYIKPSNFEEFLKYISQHGNIVLCSYAKMNEDRVYEIDGWLNNYTQRQLKNMFAEAGFRAVAELGTWKDVQYMYKFMKV